MSFKVLLCLSSILIFPGTLHAQQENSGVAQIRVYQLKSDSQDAFHQLVVNQSVPLLKKWNINVSSYGRSSGNKNGYYLIRTFENIWELERKESDFYGSDEWKNAKRSNSFINRRLQHVAHPERFGKELFYKIINHA